MPSDDLPTFLLARIAEDEQVAAEARPHEYLRTRDDVDLSLGSATGGVSALVIRSGRVLAECEAKRGLIQICADADACSDHINQDAILGWLALPYADHPDCQLGWLPGGDAVYQEQPEPPPPKVIGRVVAVVDEDHGLRVTWERLDPDDWFAIYRRHGVEYREIRNSAASARQWLVDGEAARLFEPLGVRAPDGSFEAYSAEWR